MARRRILVAVTFGAAIAAGCSAHRTALNTDERIVFIPPSAEADGQSAPGLQGTVTHVDRANRQATLVTRQGETLTVQLQPVTAGLLREGDVIRIDAPVISRR
jgi:hypothetical protein